MWPGIFLGHGAGRVLGRDGSLGARIERFSIARALIGFLLVIHKVFFTFGWQNPFLVFFRIRSHFPCRPDASGSSFFEKRRTGSVLPEYRIEKILRFAKEIRNHLHTCQECMVWKSFLALMEKPPNLPPESKTADDGASDLSRLVSGWKKPFVDSFQAV